MFRNKVWNPREGVPRHRSREEFKAATRGAGRGKENIGSFREGLPIRHHVSIWYDDYERLMRQQADILITHEAPECHPNGFRTLGELAEAMGVRLVVHGHHHAHYQGSTLRGITVIGVAQTALVNEWGELVACTD